MAIDFERPSATCSRPAGQAPSGLDASRFDQAQGLHILQHSLGVDQYGRGRQYRNHFVTGEGSIDHPTCVALTNAGLMTRRAGNPLTGDMDLFLVTDAGRAFVAEQSPAPPKLSRSKLRYRRYLDADCGLSFGEWLRHDRASDRIAA